MEERANLSPDLDFEVMYAEAESMKAKVSDLHSRSNTSQSSGTGPWEGYEE